MKTPKQEPERDGEVNLGLTVQEVAKGAKIAPAVMDKLKADGITADALENAAKHYLEEHRSQKVEKMELLVANVDKNVKTHFVLRAEGVEHPEGPSIGRQHYDNKTGAPKPLANILPRPPQDPEKEGEVSVGLTFEEVAKGTKIPAKIMDKLKADGITAEALQNAAKHYMEGRSNLKLEDKELLVGNVDKNNKTHFWLGAKGVELPEPRFTRHQLYDSKTGAAIPGPNIHPRPPR